MSNTDSTIICKAISRCLSNPSEKNVSAVMKRFWNGLPDGDEMQPLRFLVYGIRALQRRGEPINEENVIDYLRCETYDMTRPCKRFLKKMKQ